MMFSPISPFAIEAMIVADILANPLRLDMLQLPDPAAEFHRLYQTSSQQGLWSDQLVKHVVDSLNWTRIVTLVERGLPAHRRPDRDHLVTREAEPLPGYLEAAE